MAGEGIRAELHRVRVHMASAPIGCAAARPTDFRISVTAPKSVSVGAEERPCAQQVCDDRARVPDRSGCRRLAAGSLEFPQPYQLLSCCSGPVRSSPWCCSMSAVSASFWHAAGTGRAVPVCRVSKYRFGGVAGLAMAILTLAR